MATGTGMKTMKFKVGGDAAKREAGVTTYAGPIPRDGSYRTKLKFALIIKNSNGDPMITGLAEINEKKGSAQAKYNGYGIWFQQNITDQGAGYVNSLLESWTDGTEDAKQMIKEAFWEEGPKVKQGDKPFKGQPAMHIKRIGDVAINSPECKIEFIIVGKYENTSKYGEQLRAQGYAPLSAVESQFSEVDEDDEDDEDEAPAVAVKKAPAKKKPVKKAPEPEDDDDDDVSDEPTDYDEDEEPEKVKAAAKKKAVKRAEAEDDEDEDEDEDTSDDDEDDTDDADDSDDDDDDGEPPF